MAVDSSCVESVLRESLTITIHAAITACVSWFNGLQAAQAVRHALKLLRGVNDPARGVKGVHRVTLILGSRFQVRLRGIAGLRWPAPLSLPARVPARHRGRGRR